MSNALSRGLIGLGLSLISTPCFAQAPPAPTSAAPAANAAKRRVAVLDFGYGTVQTYVAQIFGSNQDIGKGIADLVIDRLTNDGSFRVIERRIIDQLMAEQNFSNSDRADPTSAAKIGKLLGVDSIIVGDVTQFGRDDSHVGGTGGLGHYDKFGIGGIGVKKAKAVVGITARIIDVNTGEILASIQGKGESQRQGTNLGGGGGDWAGSGGGNFSMGSSNFGQTIIGEATNAAVTDLSQKLEAKATVIPTQTVHIEGVVADVTGNEMILNVGSKGGVHVGDKFVVSRVTRVVNDPVTGKPLKKVAEPVGEVTINQVDEDSSTGKFGGGGAPKVGDTFKSPGN